MILEPLPIVSVYCDGAKWKGEPEQGFWCYDQPESPGPQKQKPQVLPPKRPLPREKGYPRCGAGWYDAQGLGEALDYCRWVGDGGCRSGGSWWSCALAGKTEEYTLKGMFSEPPPANAL
eukprot:TRINITY_DN8836_c0_g1_i5.p1 TRINITY_DN8836_c0_g1~~TRINITY_DN8836_c0_g1_i5.p1  ORF type:complete len:119 (-),score=21.23 TRINITY_DN8836_c0_g1_i5:190-546(-)